MTTAHQLKTFAHHQAGHAVACCYLKVGFKCVTIDTGEPHFTPIKKRGVYTDNQFIAIYAGEYAQRKAGHRGRMTWSSVEDHKTCQEMWDIVGDEDSQCSMLQGQLARRRAEVLVHLCWEDIEVVALGLLAHKRLTYAEVVQTIDSVEERHVSNSALTLNGLDPTLLAGLKIGKPQ